MINLQQNSQHMSLAYYGQTSTTKTYKTKTRSHFFSGIKKKFIFVIFDLVFFLFCDLKSVRKKMNVYWIINCKIII